MAERKGLLKHMDPKKYAVKLKIAGKVKNKTKSKVRELLVEAAKMGLRKNADLERWKKKIEKEFSDRDADALKYIGTVWFNFCKDPEISEKDKNFVIETFGF